MAPLNVPSPSSDASSSPFSPSMPPLEPCEYPSYRPSGSTRWVRPRRWMSLLDEDRSPTSGLYRIRLTYRGLAAKPVNLISPRPTDPPHAPFFGRLAPGACAPPPLCSSSTQNHGDAGVIGTAQTAVNRYNFPSSRPRRAPVHTAPLVPPAVLPKDELHSDSSCSDLPDPAHTPLYSPLLPNPHEAPFASPLALLPLYSEYRLSSPPSPVVDLASLRTPIIVEAPMTSSSDLEAEDMDAIDPYVELPLTPPRWPMDGRVHGSASSAVQFNLLGLHIGPEAVLPGSERGDTTPRSGPASSLQVSSSLSERLRRLAPAPLFIPNAGSFMSDSGIEVSRTPPRGIQIPVTALYFPPAHAPLQEHRAQQAPDSAVNIAQEEVPGSSTTRFFQSPPRAPEDPLRISNAPSLRSPPPLGRHAPRSLPSMTPSIRSPLGSGRSVTRPELVVFGGQDDGNTLSPLAWTGQPSEEPIDDVAGRALSCVPAVDWVFYVSVLVPLLCLRHLKHRHSLWDVAHSSHGMNSSCCARHCELR